MLKFRDWSFLSVREAVLQLEDEGSFFVFSSCREDYFQSLMRIMDPPFLNKFSTQNIYIYIYMNFTNYQHSWFEDAEVKGLEFPLCQRSRSPTGG